MAIRQRADSLQVFHFGASQMNILTQDHLIPYSVTTSAIVQVANLPLPGRRELSTLYVRHIQTGTGTGSITYQVLVNGVVSLLELQVLVTQSQAVLRLSGDPEDPGQTKVVVEDQNLAVRAVKNGVIETSPMVIVALA